MSAMKTCVSSNSRPRKDHYTGEIKEQLRNGYGVYSYANTFFRYEGEWLNGKKHVLAMPRPSLAKLHLHLTRVEIGGSLNSDYQFPENYAGHGRLIMADGSYYEGQFKDGEIEGHGYKYYASNGRTFSGQFHQGELQGHGVMRYCNGALYEGEWCKNKREGYGIMRDTKNCVYDGYYYGNKRHGEGSQTYVDGDRYDGDWIMDKRHGHGEIRHRDGTMYDGQWRNDLMSGHGVMIHSSGIIYEGVWSNNRPVKMASKLVIVLEEVPMVIPQGDDFMIRVECHNGDDEVVQEDKGRELQITAGFKFQPTTESKKSLSTALFDVIEDVEEKPVMTPFGYPVMAYPLTDQEEGTDRSEDATTTAPISQDVITEEEKEDEEKAVVFTQPDSAAELDIADDQDATTATSTAGDDDDLSLPLPVGNQRTSSGVCVWSYLELASPPPMYRPYILMDEEAEAVSKPRSKRPSSISAEKNTDEKNKSKKHDDKRARPGTYVIMVHDVTNPPFMGYQLEPAFAVITVNKGKKGAAGKKDKENRPRWDTKQHIAQSMARRSTESSEELTGIVEDKHT